MKKITIDLPASAHGAARKRAEIPAASVVGAIAGFFGASSEPGVEVVAHPHSADALEAARVRREARAQRRAGLAQRAAGKGARREAAETDAVNAAASVLR